MLYTARMVASYHHGEAAYTRRTALCSTRTAVIRLYPDSLASWAHAMADRNCNAHVTC